MANSNYNCYGYLPVISCVVLLLIAQIGTGHEEAGSLLGGKKLIIGVPKKSGLTQFVDVQLNSSDQSQVVKVKGYSIDVFHATIAYLKRLDHNISFEYRAFLDEDGNSAGYYDELLYQIFEGKYDAVVGDVTIEANRSNYVDFALPYAQYDVQMLVKVRHNPRLDMWIFSRPFSWDLWLSIILVSIFIGAIILFMERKVMEDSEAENSPRRRQLSGHSIFWLPIVQAVFPKRESLTKNCSRFVLVLWMILVFVLMQSYTGCLSSILIVHQLQPRYPSENDLRTDPNVNVGYQGGSFVGGFLLDEFDKSRVKSYSDIKEYKEALDKGSHKGGVDAIFDEAPFIKVFLKQYGSNYAMVGTSHRTGGFGFAFPRGSNLTSYFSRAILNVSESSGQMDWINEKYFGSSNDEVRDQSNSSSDDASAGLTAYSFAGLFMVIGILSLLALLVSESRRIWRKPVMLVTTYSQQFLSWRSTRTSPSEEGSTTRGNVDEGVTIGSEAGGDNHGTTASLSCINNETPPV